MRSILRVMLMMLTAATLLMAASLHAADIQEFAGHHAAIWRLHATHPVVIGGYGDNFDYSGKKSTATTGSADILADADLDRGTMIATFHGTIHPEKDKTYTGDIKLVYRLVHRPDTPPFMEGGVADFVYLHGDTQQGAPVMPKIRTFLASWGPVDVYVNGELVYEGVEGHMMYTERSRDVNTHAIYADASREKSYSPMSPTHGYIVAPNERELHFIAEKSAPDKGNFPPAQMFLHLNYGAVEDLGD